MPLNVTLDAKLLRVLKLDGIMEFLSKYTAHTITAEPITLGAIVPTNSLTRSRLSRIAVTTWGMRNTGTPIEPLGGKAVRGLNGSLPEVRPYTPILRAL
ncbi:MAG: hypothetical protein IT169_14030 [Bryobacterales bacterium]|nr:hypothetical protein [Bryobacterales bacterium]